MSYLRRCIFVLSLALPLGVTAKDNAAGPWNIEFGMGAQLESNNNIYYEESNPNSDMITHLVPAVSFEFEKLRNVLFAAEIELDASLYSSNGDANITETRISMEARPVNQGGYLVFSEDYERQQNTAPGADELLETGVNILELGGGYRGNHLDFSLRQAMTAASYSPSSFSELNYGIQETIFKFEYLYESFSFLSDINIGSLNYQDNGFEDGTFRDISFGMKKVFFPKNSFRFMLGNRNEDHGSSGDSFSGMLYQIEVVHISKTGRGRFHLILEKDLHASTTPGSDFAEIMYLRIKSHNTISRKISLETNLRYQLDEVGSTAGRETSFGVMGMYTPLDIQPRKHMSRKRKKPAKQWKPTYSITFGFNIRNRKSDESANEYSQTRLYGGVKVRY